MFLIFFFRFVFIFPRVNYIIQEGMATVGAQGIGIPMMMLHEGEGLTVTVESKLGDIYRGILYEAEDTMNLHMKNVTHVDADGKVRKLEEVYIRGTQISFVTFPDILSESPIFERIRKHKAAHQE